VDSPTATETTALAGTFTHVDGVFHNVELATLGSHKGRWVVSGSVIHINTMGIYDMGCKVTYPFRLERAHYGMLGRRWRNMYICGRAAHIQSLIRFLRQGSG
jgi:hypothetical protein